MKGLWLFLEAELALGVFVRHSERSTEDVGGDNDWVVNGSDRIV